MHIPDGILSAKTAIASAVISAGALAIALRQARRNLPRRRVPLMGLTAAFLFAAQMINFPIGAGTSGHLVGAVLAATLVGPAAAVVVMSAVLIVQCLLFSDGGATALGANMLNMAVIAAIAGYAIYAAIHRLLPTPRGRIVAAAFAAWCATVLAAGACAIELIISRNPGPILPAMVAVHMLVGIGEAIITALVLAAIARTRPELLENSAAPFAQPQSSRRPTIIAGLIAVLCIAIAAPLASKYPDGLERVAQKLGFAGRATTALSSPLSDYHIPGIGSAALATVLAALIGAIVAFALSLLLARMLVPNPQRSSS